MVPSSVSWYDAYLTIALALLERPVIYVLLGSIWHVPVDNGAKYVAFTHVHSLNK